MELCHLDLLRPYFKSCTSRLCDCTVGGTFMWRDYFKTSFAVENETLYIRVDDFYGKTAFACPIGGDLETGIMNIIKYSEENGIPVAICMVSEDNAEKVRVLTMGKIRAERAWFDYLYNSEDIKSFAGRKYSGQRNHINKFLKENEQWSFETLTPDNIEPAKAFLQTFIDSDSGEFNTLTEGDRKAMEILDNFASYGLIGGVLTVFDKIVGLSIGEILGDTLFIHVEKALRQVQGAYPMLMREFARAFAAEGVEYINREEDDGNEGLRTSKLSYHPVKLLEKNLIIV